MSRSWNCTRNTVCPIHQKPDHSLTSANAEPCSGSLVRVSPVEVSIKDIEVYEPFNNPGTSVFSERDKVEHSAEKRLMSHAFSRTNVTEIQGLLYSYCIRWISMIQGHVAEQTDPPLAHQPALHTGLSLQVQLRHGLGHPGVV